MNPKFFPLFMLASAIGFFPHVLNKRHHLPATPPASKIAWQSGHGFLGFFHNFKNQTSEWLRADCEWWGKFLCAVILIQVLAIAALL